MDDPGFPATVTAAARDAARAQIRSGYSGEDAVIDTLAASALALAEAFLGQVLIVREFRAVLPVDSCWAVLPAEPVTAISAVEGLPAEGAAFAMPVGDYALDIDARGQGWVRVQNGGAAGRVRVTFTAGLAADWDGLPAPIRQGVLLLIAHLFDDRTAAGAPPAAVTALWRPWRRVRIDDAAGFRARTGG